MSLFTVCVCVQEEDRELRCSGCKIFVLLQKYEKVTNEFIYDVRMCAGRRSRAKMQWV